MRDSYVLLGAEVRTSPSPKMFNAAFEALGIESDYTARDVSADSFAEVFGNLKEEHVKGMNVTIPHKESVLSLLDSLDDTSRKVGAVNTISREGDGFRGFNTDVDGIVEPLIAEGTSRPARAVLIGTGGAARAFCGAMETLGCREVTVISRNALRAEAFAAVMRPTFSQITFSAFELGADIDSSFDLFFNASPLGSNGTGFPQSALHLIGPHTTVFDAVYCPIETQLLRGAADRGCKTIHGYEMLLHQALHAFRIWTGHEPPMEVMLTTLLSELRTVAA